MDLLEVPKALFRRHPWEVARARFFRNVLERAGVLDTVASVLDVGAGDGYLSATLLRGAARGSRVTCVDPNYTDQEMAHFAEIVGNAVSFTRTRPTQRFEIALLLDVLEHVADDGQFLNEIVRDNVVEGGTVLVSVPAWQVLFTQHDAGLNHFRRYSPAALRRLINGANLTTITRGGLFHGAVFVRAVTAIREAAARRLGRQVPPSAHLGQWNAGPLVSGLIERCLFVDNFASQRMAEWDWSMPGLSCWALCRKKSPS